RARIADVGGKETNGVVAPVVGETALSQMLVGYKLVYWHEFYRRNAQGAEILHDCRARQTRIGPTQLWRHVWMTCRKSFDMQLIDQGWMPRGTGGRIVPPAKGRINDNALRETRGAIPLIPCEVGVWVANRVAK